MIEIKTPIELDNLAGTSQNVLHLIDLNLISNSRKKLEIITGRIVRY